MAYVTITSMVETMLDGTRRQTGMTDGDMAVIAKAAFTSVSYHVYNTLDPDKMLDESTVVTRFSGPGSICGWSLTVVVELNKPPVPDTKGRHDDLALVIASDLERAVRESFGFYVWVRGRTHSGFATSQGARA